MRNDHYPTGTVTNLLQTDFVSPQTKAVLQQRLHTPLVTEPRFFTKEEFATLQVIAERLLPQGEREQKIDLAGILDRHFVEKKIANGWRYNAMPPDEIAFKKGLAAIEKTSQALYKNTFGQLGSEQQDQLLSDVQTGNIDNHIWEGLPSALFFEELFAALVEIYYSHPIGKDEIGDASMADVPRWNTIGLQEREQREPERINDEIE